MTLERLDRLRTIYPESLQLDSERGADKDAFNYQMLRDHLRAAGGADAHLVDLGGGFAAHNLLLAQDGFRVTVVDTFSGYWGDSHDASSLVSRFSEHGVMMVEADLLEWTPLDRPHVLFSAHCLEHFHQSPLPMLRRCVDQMEPGARCVVCVPNAVNLRKRMAVVRGRSNLAPFDEFFLQDGPFLGHVREYTVSDLRGVAAALDLADIDVFGRNWLGRSRLAKSGPLIELADKVLQSRPGLCSDLYLSGAVSLVVGG